LNKFKKDKILYLVTDAKLCGEKPLEEVVESAILGGVDVVQLREKHSSKEEFLRIGRSIKTICDAHQVPLIINDCLDTAVALDAAGVHIGQSDLPYEVVRKKLGPDKIIGLTINTLIQAKDAESLDVDYLGVGPIFPTLTKLDAGDLWGFDNLNRLRNLSRHTLIGIGGINQSNAGKLMEIGFNGIAVVTAICAAKCPRTNAKELSSLLL